MVIYQDIMFVSRPEVLIWFVGTQQWVAGPYSVGRETFSKAIIDELFNSFHSMLYGKCLIQQNSVRKFCILILYTKMLLLGCGIADGFLNHFPYKTINIHKTQK